MNPFKVEIATIGFSPFNEALEALDAQVTQYENQEEAVAGLRFRQSKGFEMPTLIICCAGMERPLYDELAMYCASLSLQVPLVIYDQAFSALRRRDAKILGAAAYLAEPISEERLEQKLFVMIDEQLEKRSDAIATYHDRLES